MSSLMQVQKEKLTKNSSDETRRPHGRNEEEEMPETRNTAGDGRCQV